MTTFAAARMFKRNTKTKRKVCVEPFDETGEIQVVPIDTVVGDGGYDLEVDDASGNRAQDSSKSRDTTICSRSRWREPDIVA